MSSKPCDVQDDSNTIIISSEHFARTNGHKVESYVLQFKVTCKHAEEEDVLCNGETTGNRNHVEIKYVSIFSLCETLAVVLHLSYAISVQYNNNKS